MFMERAAVSYFGNKHSSFCQGHDQILYSKTSGVDCSAKATGGWEEDVS